VERTPQAKPARAEELDKGANGANEVRAMVMDVVDVKRVGMVYLERDTDGIELMIVDFAENTALSTKLYEWGSESFLLAFGELLLEHYKSKYEREANEVRKLKEHIEDLKKRGYNTASEEADLRRHENEAIKYARKYDVLSFALQEFKKVLEGQK
jgi:uncharacterized protein YgfB (UPF0149 family)